MDSVGKRKSKESNPDENPQKKTRRKSCLAKKTVNVQRDPTEPVVKTKKSRVSFAPKECHVKGFSFSILKWDKKRSFSEFSSYNSSGNSSLNLDPSTLTQSFSNENKENTLSPLINQVSKVNIRLHQCC